MYNMPEHPLTREELKRRLEAVDELNGSGVRGTVTFENSLDEPEILALSRALLDYEEEE